MIDLNLDTRIHKHDPMVGYLIRANQVWRGSDRSQYAIATGFQSSFDDLWDLAKDYEDRDRFEAIAREVHIKLMDSIGLVMNKYGGSPGGYPYSEGDYIVSHVEYANDHPDSVGYFTGKQTKYWMTFGVCENFDETGTQWYVEYKSDETSEPIAYAYLSWAEVSADRIAGYLTWFMEEARAECGQRR